MGETEDYFSWWSPCLSFFMCPCYNRRAHYPTLEKHGAQNITARENQDKQHELSDNGTLKKKAFGKNNRG